jgi:hypothetical protein
MKDLEQLVVFARSDLPDRMDDDAFRADMQFLETEDDIADFAQEFGVASTTIEGWKEGRYVPQPALRPRYCRWLRQRAGVLAARAEPSATQAQAGFAAAAAGKLSGH